MECSLNARVPWTELIRQELTPFHGRLAGSLRTTLAVAIAVTAAMVFRMPAAAPGIYLIFLVSYETPYLTLTSGLYTLGFQCLGIAAALLLVIVTDNSPMARVLGTALFSFLAAFLLRTMRRRGAMDFGVFSLNTLALWDLHRPADDLVRAAIWPIGVGAIAVLSTVAIEYAFARRDPFYALHKEFETRIRAIENYLLAYSGSPGSPSLALAARQVIRFSFAGQGRMLALLDEISNRREGAQEKALDLHLLLPHVFRLLDLAASFTLEESPGNASTEHRERAARLAKACAELRENLRVPGESLRGLEVRNADDLLSQMENALVDLRVMKPYPAMSLREPASSHRAAVPWFIADAWTNPDYLHSGLQIALCSTLCYVLYMALAWPGISTAVITVLIVGLNHTGAISQKLVFRITGSFLGGVIFGIGSIVFLFPHMDTITSMVALVCTVSFIGAWIARAPHFSYIGMQIVFSFFLIVLGTSSAPVDMTPARDRLVGIGLALLLVWIVFLEVAPTRTVARMSAALAHVLASQAEFLQLSDASGANAHRDSVRLRESITRDLLDIRGMSELVPYEFASRSEADRKQSSCLLEASLAAGSLLLALESWFQQSPSEWASARRALSKQLTSWSSEVASKHCAGDGCESMSAMMTRLPDRVLSAQIRLAVSIAALAQIRDAKLDH